MYNRSQQSSGIVVYLLLLLPVLLLVHRHCYLLTIVGSNHWELVCLKYSQSLDFKTVFKHAKLLICLDPQSLSNLSRLKTFCVALKKRAKSNLK